MGQLSKTLKNHQTINELWLQVRKFLYKSLLNLAFLWSGAQLATSKKKQKYILLPDHQLPKNMVPVFVS